MEKNNNNLITHGTQWEFHSSGFCFYCFVVFLLLKTELETSHNAKIEFILTETHRVDDLLNSVTLNTPWKEVTLCGWKSSSSPNHLRTSTVLYLLTNRLIDLLPLWIKQWPTLCIFSQCLFAGGQSFIFHKRSAAVVVIVVGGLLGAACCVAAVVTLRLVWLHNLDSHICFSYCR